MDRIIQKNGYIKKELLLLRPFLYNPWKRFTISEIKTLTGTKSHHFVHNAMKTFTGLKILNEERQGNTNVYSINFETSYQIRYLTILESAITAERNDIPLDNLEKITKRLKDHFYSLIIGGSYAEKKQTAKSDLDIAFIIPDNTPKKDFEIALKEGDLMIPQIHGFVFTQDEFYQMLTNDEFNFGKELVKKHLIVQGSEQYYKIILEALKNGFKGRYVHKESKN